MSVRIPDEYYEKDETSTGDDGSTGGDTGSTGGDTGSSGGDDVTDYKSSIVIEHVRALDKDGKTITDITKETEPFTLEVIYTDVGLLETYEDDIYRDGLYAYLTDAGAFIPQGPVLGTLSELRSNDGHAPRFMATFSDLKYGGGAENFSEIKFQVQYDIRGYIVLGEGAARFYGIIPDDDDSDDDTAPPTPYIIISAYDLGAEQIEAGSTFTLGLNFKNTSKDIALENIRMTINPVSTEQQQSYLSIASATNTYFYETMGAGGGNAQSVDVLVKGSATVGSQAVTVDFSYEYVYDKKREEGSTSTTIYIPITQIDRFSVDPITDYATYVEVGSEGYATITFANLGKATTYNVSGYILDENGEQGQTEHFGNVEAGASGSLDFSFYPYTPGEYRGVIVIRYENENGEEKEIETEFFTSVEEPWHPPVDPNPIDPGMLEPEEPSTPWWKILLFVVGGIGIAGPVALYLAKRVTAKGSEEFDEDF